MNIVVLSGRLTKEPVIKFIGDNTAVCNFTIAVQRPYKDKETGEYITDFIQCQAWKSQAEFIGTYVKKGHKVELTGAINTRTYEKDDVTHYVTEVNVNQVQSLEKKESNSTIITKESIEADWKAEWEKRSVGLDSGSKANLKKDLTKKYNKLLAELDLPF